MDLEWYKNIYNMIEYFSDINILSDAWFGFNKKNASYFGEDLNIIFDDLCFDDFIEELKSENIKEDLLNAIIDFRDSLSFYEVPKSGLAIDILNDPKFLTVVSNAKKVVERWSIPK